MKHLKFPLTGVETKQVYEECVQSFRDKDLRNRLEQCADLVERDSKKFEENFPQNIMQLSESELPDDVSGENLVDVYKYKFAKMKSPGRRYYDKLLNAPREGICPICGVRTVSTLDHYLPKSEYPLLVITLPNLIPSCFDCNHDKMVYIPKRMEDAPFHPYFDDLSDVIWLEAEIFEDQTIKYYVVCPETWDRVLKERVSGFLEVYNLQELYAAQAVVEFESMQLWMKKIFQRKGSIELHDYLVDMKESVEAADLNSWKAALYRALLRQQSIVESWLMQGDNNQI